jgi:hypothetical protein
LFAISPSIEKEAGEALPSRHEKASRLREKHAPFAEHVEGRLRVEHLKIPLGRKILLRSWNEAHAPTTGPILN